jgi:hypothetical protein
MRVICPKTCDRQLVRVDQDIRNLDHQGFSDALPLFRVTLDGLLELSVLSLARIGESS